MVTGMRRVHMEAHSKGAGEVMKTMAAKMSTIVAGVFTLDNSSSGRHSTASKGWQQSSWQQWSATETDDTAKAGSAQLGSEGAEKDTEQKEGRQKGEEAAPARC